MIESYLANERSGSIIWSPLNDFVVTALSCSLPLPAGTLERVKISVSSQETSQVVKQVITPYKKFRTQL